MTLTEKFIQAASISAAMLVAIAATAQTFPAPKEGAYILKDFKFHTGEVMPELRMNYTTVGDPKGEPVLVMHGTTGSGTGMLNPAYGGQLFGSGQPLDATKYFIILPDSVGTGKSSKPSDGLKAAFPRYNYNDTVDAQYRLITEHFGIKKLRLVYRQLDGRYADLGVGHALPGDDGRLDADGLAAHRHVQPQLDDAPPHYRLDPQ